LRSSLDRISKDAEIKIKNFLGELTTDFYDVERFDQIMHEANLILKDEGMMPR